MRTHIPFLLFCFVPYNLEASFNLESFYFYFFFVLAGSQIGSDVTERMHFENEKRGVIALLIIDWQMLEDGRNEVDT